VSRIEGLAGMSAPDRREREIHRKSERGEAGILEDLAADRVEIGDSLRAAYASPEDVFEQEYRRLVRALTVIAGERETAADAVQEAFIKLVSRWDHISKYEDPAGWVRRVALNKIREQRRSVWRQTRLVLRMQQQLPVPGEGALVTDQELWERLRALPLKQRTAVALHFLGDLTAKETAHVMRVSEGTVDQHLHRALRTLKPVFEEPRDE
jgi:RNA polymerase sigma-70 factor, ECF subfamily